MSRTTKGVEEVFGTCPYCWQRISLIVDITPGDQEYIEDCEVCCRPIAVRCTFGDTGTIDLSLDRAD